MTASDDRYAAFAAWLDTTLAKPPPPAVVAFSLNLYEGIGTFDVQLSGASSFDPHDEAWTCNPIYADERNLFRISREAVSDRWEGALELALGCMERYLKEGERAGVLRASRAVAVGFVDGDLRLVWPDGVACAAGREEAAVLAKSDPAAALAVARNVRDPWYRAQALACVARYAPDAEVERIAAEAMDVCRQCPDSYQRVAAAAWPLRALVERGALVTARAHLVAVLEEERHVEPPSSRSESLFLLFQACFDLGSDGRETLIRRLAAAHEVGGGWRSRCNLADALAMLAGSDPRLASEITASVVDERACRRAERAGSERAAPRSFFW